MHEELIPVTARWTDPKIRTGSLSPYAKDAEAKTMGLLDDSLIDGIGIKLIPVPDIRRRYVRGFRNLHQIYLPMVDDAWVLNGAVTPPEIIWRRLAGQERVFDPALWKTMTTNNKGEA